MACCAAPSDNNGALLLVTVTVLSLLGNVVLWAIGCVQGCRRLVCTLVQATLYVNNTDRYVFDVQHYGAVERINRVWWRPCDISGADLVITTFARDNGMDGAFWESWKTRFKIDGNRTVMNETAS